MNRKEAQKNPLLRPRYRSQSFKAMTFLTEKEVKKKIGQKKQLRFLSSTSHYLLLLLFVVFLLLWFRPWEAILELIRII